MSNQDDGLLYLNMRSMISLIDKLRDFNLHEYISLPRIAVLGEQSAGKSSLLEAICGLNFLPRGSGICTRRPLELRMIRTQLSEPYFLFPDDYPNKKITNPKEATQIIEQLTDKDAGSEKNISKNAIKCVVYSASVPDLTLIDLPGVTRNPVQGQPENIEEITKDLVKFYCQNEDTLILCVIPANIDLSNSDALKLSRTLDPSGERTLGVLTKIDLMDEGTDARKTLFNEEIKLKYGYVGIKGRSQADIKRGMTVAESIQKELDFFGKHPLYQTMPNELLGTRSLVDRVSTLLYKMIQKGLPRIKKEIFERKKKVKENLKRLGNDFPETEEKKLELVFKLVREFKDHYTQQINGKYIHNSQHHRNKMTKNSETMIYQLNQLFGDLYCEYAKKDFKISEQYTDETIRRAIETYQSVSIPGFHSFDSFLYLMHPQIDKLKEPIIHLLDECKLILELKGCEIIDRTFKKFAILHHEVKESFNKELSQRKTSVRKILENLIRCEDNYLFTNDPIFLLNKSDVDKKEIIGRDLLVMELRQKIDKYFFILVRNLRDVVPKLVGQFLVKQFNKTIERDILNCLNKKDYCLESLDENKATALQRKNLKKELDSLTKAESLLINDFNMGFSLELDQQLTQQSQKKITFDDKEIDEMEQYLENIEKLNQEFLDFNEKLIDKNQSIQPNRRPISNNTHSLQRPAPSQDRYNTNQSSQSKQKISQQRQPNKTQIFQNTSTSQQRRYVQERSINGTQQKQVDPRHNQKERLTQQQPQQNQSQQRQPPQINFGNEDKNKNLSRNQQKAPKKQDPFEFNFLNMNNQQGTQQRQNTNQQSTSQKTKNQQKINNNLFG